MGGKLAKQQADLIKSRTAYSRDGGTDTPVLPAVRWHGPGGYGRRSRSITCDRPDHRVAGGEHQPAVRRERLGELGRVELVDAAEYLAGELARRGAPPRLERSAAGDALAHRGVRGAYRVEIVGLHRRGCRARDRASGQNARAASGKT
jgi:hypothetical protein